MTLASIIAADFGGSQKAFAEKSGVDEGQLSKYLAAERGEPKGQRPSADNVARIEKATGGRISSSYWFALKQRERPPRPRRAV